MSDFTNEFETRFPTSDEVERIMARARALRARMIRNAAISAWAVLQRSVTRRDAPRTA